MAYQCIFLKDLPELRGRRGNNITPLLATILGLTYPVTEAFTVYEWRDSSVDTPDDNEVVASILGSPSIGRWHKVDPAGFVQINSDWNSTSGPSRIINKPNLSAIAVSGTWSDILNRPVFSNVAASGAYADLSGKPVLTTVASTGQYSDLIGIPVLSVVAGTGNYNDLSNKPVIPAAQVQTDWNAISGLGQILNKPSLSPVAFTGKYSDLSGQPVYSAVSYSGSYTDLTNVPAFAQVAFTGIYSDIVGKPSFSVVATSGSYNDLLNKPAIPAAQIKVDWSATSGMAEILNKPSFSGVAYTGSYADLLNKPVCAQVAISGNYADLSNKPVFASVALTGAYADLSGKPALSAAGMSGNYADLLNKPVIPDAQISADWNATVGVARILNKPVIITTVATTSANGLMSASDKVKLDSSPKIHRIRAQTNSNGELTWVFPSAFSAGVIPVIGVTVEDNSGATFNHRLTAVTNTSVSIKLDKSSAVTLLGISILGIANNPQAYVHVTAMEP